jgi:HK97 family phage portal protein
LPFRLPFLTKAQPAPVEQKALTIADWPAAFLLPPVAGNIVVTPLTAMSVPAVACAVGLLSDLCGTLPAAIYTRGGDDARTTNPTDPTNRLVSAWANDWTTAASLRTQMTADALLYDRGGFALANRAADGRVVEFNYLPPSMVTPKLDVGTMEPSFDVAFLDGGIRTYSYRDILHIRAPIGLGPWANGPIGIAPITLARNAIALAQVLEQHGNQLFANGAFPGGLLKELPDPGAASVEGQKAKQNFLTAFMNTHGGAANGGKPLLLPRGLDWQKTALSSVDAQFLEARRYQVEEIARAFRVPPTMLMDLERGTWSNTEQMQRQFLQFCLAPWLDSWKGAYERVLLDPAERATSYVDFDTDKLLDADFFQRFQAYSLAISSRVLSPNEVRARENMAPFAGGDEHANPNVIPANSNLKPPAGAA